MNLAIGPLRSTRRACQQAIMVQETQFFTTMGNVTTIDPSGRIIMRRDASGAAQVVLSSP
ncbi:MAG: META domain-containing protein [Chromatiales bacterium]